MAKKYKVIALNVGSDRRNKVYYSGDIVEESYFAPDHAEKLVKEGFLQPIEEETGEEEDAGEATNASTGEVNPEANEAGEDPGKTDAGEDETEGEEETGEEVGEEKIPSLNDITVNEMKADLTEAKVEFKAAAKKEDLYELWVALKGAR